MIRKSMLTTRQLTDEYFLENRNRLLDIAAFLDRLERSSDGVDPDSDFRIRALRKAMQELLSDKPGRAGRVHMILSDPTSQPRERLDTKAAFGAFNPALEVRS